MSRISPRSRRNAAELEDAFARAEQALGFVPNKFFVMARSPGIMRAFSRLSREVIGVPGKEPLPLKRLVSYIASRIVAYQYCSANTAVSAVEIDGLPARKIEANSSYETSPPFSEAERAELRFAQSAALVPNEVTNVDMDDLKTYFDEDQVVELVSVICVFGWLNRWNDIMAPMLEEHPLSFGEVHLSKSGWSAGKHKQSQTA